MLGVVNFAHGALYMLGAYAIYTLVTMYSCNFWLAALIAPIIIGGIGILMESTLLRWLYSRPPFYALLLTFGLSFFFEGLIRMIYGPSGKPFKAPVELAGSVDLGIIIFPQYRLFIMGVTALLSFAVWFFLQKTKLGMRIRAGTDDSQMVDALGIDISRIFTIVFGVGAAFAGLAGVLAAPIQNVSFYMGSSLIGDIFAIVIIGGMGSVLGSIVSALVIGDLITLGVIFWPPLANIVIYFFMAFILLIRPRGFFGREKFHE
jgi:branched-chain amino acid transport system permease protein